MSVRISSDRLAFAILLGPIAALTNQGVTYALTVSACGRYSTLPIHLVPALCLAMSLRSAFVGYRAYRRSTGETRSRFMSIAAIGTGLFSSLVIIALWMALFAFSPCVRA
jgi:hypothetical protein